RRNHRPSRPDGEHRLPAANERWPDGAGQTRQRNEREEITRSISWLAAAAAATFAAQASAQAPKIVVEEMMVPSEPGIEIYVRNKRPADMAAFRPERTVLFVHVATYPAHTAFDLALDGMSWMDYIAARGYDVYLLDLRGYGKSTRPKEMADKPEANPPLARGDHPVQQDS